MRNESEQTARVIVSLEIGSGFAMSFARTSFAASGYDNDDSNRGLQLEPAAVQMKWPPSKSVRHFAACDVFAVRSQRRPPMKSRSNLSVQTSCSALAGQSFGLWRGAKVADCLCAISIAGRAPIGVASAVPAWGGAETIGLRSGSRQPDAMRLSGPTPISRAQLPSG